MMNAQIDPCVVLWQAMNEAEKVGNRTDDKLIVEFLRRAGYCIAPEPAQAQQAEPWQPISTAPTGELVLLIGDRFAGPHLGDWGDYDQYNQPRFTHWRPLPQPPKEKP